MGIYLSEHCDFKNTLEEMLRNQLVCGVNNEQIQRMLLAESSLDFKKAMKPFQCHLCKVRKAINQDWMNLSGLVDNQL